MSSPATKKRMRLKFEFRCVSDQREVGSVEAFLQKVNKRLKLDDGTLYRLLVASTEAVNNAILHGNKSDPQKYVLLTVVRTSNALSVQVRDEGKGFDPSSLPNPIAEENLLKDSGRGIFLIRQMMDEVKFAPLKTGWMIEMKVNLKRLG